jgi:hypothetical protein
MIRVVLDASLAPKQQYKRGISKSIRVYTHIQTLTVIIIP